MNKKQEILIIKKNWHSYHIPGCSHIKTIKKNAIFISNSNSIKHELAKCLGAIMIKKYGDVKFPDTVIAAFDWIDKEIAKQGFINNSSEFITEATPNKEPDRRVDLVDIKNNIRFEFETNHKVCKGDGINGEKTITIYL